MGMGSNKSSSKMVLSEINVTPLVDVMLVLLIIFMVTAPMMKQGVEVNLPETASTGMSTTDKPFVIYIKKDRKVYIGKEALAVDSLGEKITAIFKTRKNKNIYIQADKSVDYGTVAGAMAEIKSAGIFNIGLVLSLIHI